MGRIAAIDYGLARVGLAISDEMRFLARPLVCLPNTKQLSQAIVQELGKHGAIEAIVLGLPIQMNGKEGEMAQEVRKFAEELKKHTALPILFWDERLTSAQADRTLREAELSRKKRAALSDTMSATVILQSYLDSK
jgi:putative Holliday junction resolvase